MWKMSIKTFSFTQISITLISLSYIIFNYPEKHLNQFSEQKLGQHCNVLVVGKTFKFLLGKYINTCLNIFIHSIATSNLTVLSLNEIHKMSVTLWLFTYLYQFSNIFSYCFNFHLIIDIF